MQYSKITTKKTLIATAIAVVIDLIIFGIGTAAGANWDAGSPYPINAFMVALITAIPLLLAAWVVSLIARKAPKFQRIATWIGFAFALVTMAGSLTMAPQLLTALLLASMHVVVAVAWFVIANPKRVA